jgi:peptide-methionine (S)-S-oxide reductase
MTDTGTITRTPGTETAVLAGGCFWGMEDHVPRHPGVLLPDPRPLDPEPPGQ